MPPDFWGLLALRAPVFAVVMLVLFRLLSPLEHRPLPWWDAPASATGARATAAGALICIAGVALVLMAKFGLADAPGWIALGCFLGAAAAARICAAGAFPSAAARSAKPSARRPDDSVRYVTDWPKSEQISTAGQHFR